ncbi:MAG: hypothetical protein JWP12_261 [Bacteroidetes bacterium]|nr:hypothetical protein [Bacteroidota bacterium]
MICVPVASAKNQQIPGQARDDSKRGRLVSKLYITQHSHRLVYSYAFVICNHTAEL